jgi:hypothetical protein
VPRFALGVWFRAYARPSWGEPASAAYLADDLYVDEGNVFRALRSEDDVGGDTWL